MSPEDLGRDVTQFDPVGAAIVRGFRLGFTRYSRARKGGVADLVPDLDSEVEGVLYRLPLEQLPALDEREGAPDHYRRDFIAVRTPDGKMYDRVLTYVVVDKAAVDIAPHPDYAATILTGAEAYLTPRYVQSVYKFIEQLISQQQAKGAGRQQAKDGPRPPARDEPRPRSKDAGEQHVKDQAGDERGDKRERQERRERRKRRRLRLRRLLG